MHSRSVSRAALNTHEAHNFTETIEWLRYCPRMKATDIIKRDHEAIEDLFREFEDASPERRKEMEPILFDALDTHEKMEDAYFYPELKGLSEDEDRLSNIEQEQMKLKADVLAARALPGDKRERILAMMQTVLAHAEREESEVLPEAESILTSDKLEAIGEEMEPESAVANASSDV